MENETNRPQQTKAEDSSRDTDETREPRALMSRRLLFKRSSAVVATAGAATVIAGSELTAPESPAHRTAGSPSANAAAGATPSTNDTPAPEPLNFFRPREAAIIDALTARIMPGDPDDPGAREAGVLFYIDRVLAHSEGFAQPTYRQPPFAWTYEGDEPPEEVLEGVSPTIWVAKDQIQRYGFQSMMTPREVYRAGIASLDRYAQEQFDAGFADLSEDQQDSIVEDLVSGRATGFEQPSTSEFFQTIRGHTIEGMFADPIYGGNRNLVGWKLVGYPGAQRAYTPTEMRIEGTDREPQSLADLHPFHPGRANNPAAVVPISGADHDEE